MLWPNRKDARYVAAPRISGGGRMDQKSEQWYQEQITTLWNKIDALTKALVPFADKRNWKSGKIVGQPDYLLYSVWSYPVDDPRHPQVIAEEALSSHSKPDAGVEG
jgi:hypothetical protein